MGSQDPARVYLPFAMDGVRIGEHPGAADTPRYFVRRPLSLEHSPLRGRYGHKGDTHYKSKGRKTMKRALIAIASVGILAPAAWVVGANAQYGAPPPAYSQSPAYNAPQTYPRRTYRRAARRGYTRSTAAAPGAPAAAAPGGSAYAPGSGPPPYAVQGQAYAQRPYEWHAAPGPNRRGNMCVTHTDPLRGYGYQAPCPPPKR
jgi:hypothetical protein